MKVSLDNLGTIGIIKDVPGYELPLSAWSRGKNVRLKDNQVVKFKGHSLSLTSAIAPYHLTPVSSGSSTYWMIAGLNKVYAWDGLTEKDITRTTGGDYSATAAKNWNGGVIGGVPVLNNGIDVPQMWGVDFATPAKLLPLAAWDANWTTKILRPFGEFLVALDVTKSGTNYPRMVKWSHPADPNTVPASWDETDPTKDAGEYEIGEDNDRMVDCRTLGDSNIIYKERSTYRMTKIGAPYIFDFEKVFSESGLLNPRCVQSFGDKQFVVSDQDIIMHNGQTATSLIDSKLRSWLFNLIDSDNYDRSFVASNPFLKEMWFCFPQVGSTFPDTALVWNWDANTWGIRDLPEAAHIEHGQVPGTAATTWDGDTDTWDSDLTYWNSLGYPPTAPRLLMADPTNKKLFFTDNTNTFGGDTFQSYIERTGLPLGTDSQGNAAVDMFSIKYVNEVWPKITGNSKVNIYVGSQMTVDDDVTWDGPYEFDPAVDQKIDCDVTGRLLAIRFESTSDREWALHSYDMNIEMQGKY